MLRRRRPLPVCQFDQFIGQARAFAEALHDPRAPNLTERTFLEMSRSHVNGIRAATLIPYQPCRQSRSNPKAYALRRMIIRVGERDSSGIFESTETVQNQPRRQR
jgi:hypothetical protein